MKLVQYCFTQMYKGYRNADSVDYRFYIASRQMSIFYNNIIKELDK